MFTWNSTFIRNRMDIVILPVTGHSQGIRDNFLQELSLRVDLKENITDKKIQIIIFQPFGRPGEEFGDIFKTFKETGGKLDENIIFITATKPDRFKFEVPSHFNFALKTVLFLNDENQIEPQSSNAMDKIGDLLIQKYGFKPQKHASPCHDVTSGKDEIRTSTKTRVEEEMQIENSILKRKHEEMTQEKCNLQQEIKQLKQYDEELKQDKFKLQQEIKRLKQNDEELRQENDKLQQENKQLKDVEEKNRKKQEESKTYKRSGSRPDGVLQEIRFEYKEKNWFGDKKQCYSVNLDAVEEEIANLQDRNYEFQRKYEKTFFLVPGMLKEVLEFIGAELQKRSIDDPIMEGRSFHTLTEEVDKKFWLSPDDFKELLKQISTRNPAAQL